MTGRELIALASAELRRGAGVAPKLYKDAVRRGRFAPDDYGLSQEALAGWRGLAQLRLPEVTKRVEEPSEQGDATIKVAMRFADGREVESVRIPMGKGRYTLCVSSQVGCRLACGFCETAKMGLLRNLTAGEIIAQLVVARSVLGWDIRNIVFMGMGEPLDNADNVIQALRILNDDRGLGYGQQRITICTAGEVEGIRKLGALGWKRLDLSVSLNAAIDDKRDRLMPVNRRAPLAELQRALIEYPRRKKFVFGVNYCLLPGLNDSEADADAIATFIEPLGRALINVIPYNPGSKPLTRAPTEAEVERFIAGLEDRRVPVTRRITKGRSVMAACGQLGDRAQRRTLPVVP